MLASKELPYHVYLVHEASTDTIVMHCGGGGGTSMVSVAGVEVGTMFFREL